jgi:hypothetical protein
MKSSELVAALEGLGFHVKEFKEVWEFAEGATYWGKFGGYKLKISPVEEELKRPKK